MTREELEQIKREDRAMDEAETASAFRVWTLIIGILIILGYGAWKSGS